MRLSIAFPQFFPGAGFFLCGICFFVENVSGRICKKVLTNILLYDILYWHIGVWLSLVECLVRDQEAAGSNPVTPMRNQSKYSKNLSVSAFFVPFFGVFLVIITGWPLVSVRQSRFSNFFLTKIQDACRSGNGFLQRMVKKKEK